MSVNAPKAADVSYLNSTFNASDLDQTINNYSKQQKRNSKKSVLNIKSNQPIKMKGGFNKKRDSEMVDGLWIGPIPPDDDIISPRNLSPSNKLNEM